MSVWDQYKPKEKEIPAGSIWDSYKPKEERGIAGDIGAWFSGSDKRQDIPTIADIGFENLLTNDANKARLMSVIASTSDDARLEKAFQMYVPDAKTSKDEFGNLVVSAPINKGQGVYDMVDFYPNPKGLDAPTVFQGSGAVALANPVARVLGGTGYRAAAATGATEAGIIEGLASYLTNTPYKYSEIPMGGGAAMAFKGAFDVIGGVLNKVKNYVSSVGSKDSTGSRMAAIKQALREEGYDPDTVMDKVFQEINKRVNKGQDVREAARYETSQGLPTPIPMTRGEVTGDKGQQLIENAMETGGLGDTAQQSMQGIRQAQHEAIPSNLQQIQQGMAGAGAAIEERAGMQTAQEALAAQKAEAKKASSEAYDIAKGSKAYIDPADGDQIASNVYNKIFSETSETSAPKTLEIWRNEVEPLLREGQSLTDIFAARSKLSKQASNFDSDGNIAGQMARALDDELTKLADNALLYGDETAVKNWLTAISKYKEFKNVWENEGILKKLTETTGRDGETVLKVSPEDAANVIFGVGINPNKTNLARDMQKLKKMLPKDVFDQVRQEFFLKLANTMQTQGGTLTGAKFAKNWAEIKKNKTLLGAMFEKEEIGQIDALATAALRISGSAKNYSNTANSLFTMMNRFFVGLGSKPSVKALGDVAVGRMLRNAYGAGQAAKSKYAPVPTRSNTNVVLGGAAGATMGGDIGNNFGDYGSAVYDDIRKRLYGE